MSEQVRSKIIDHDREEPGIDQYVSSLLRELNGGDLSELPKVEQGRIIVDKFLGALMRQGDVTDTSGKTHKFEQTVFDMHRMSKGADESAVTRNGGRRAAVLALLDNPLTAPFAEKAFGALARDEQDSGEILLANEEQIQGYLHADERKNFVTEARQGVELAGKGWVGILEDRINIVVNRNGQWIYNPYRGIIESENDYLRQQGNEWRMAVTSAEKCGVDARLLGKSAEYIKTRREGMAQLSRRLGEHTLGQV